MLFREEMSERIIQSERTVTEEWRFPYAIQDGGAANAVTEGVKSE